MVSGGCLIMFNMNGGCYFFDGRWPLMVRGSCERRYIESAFKECADGPREGPPLLVPPTPYPQLYFWSGRPCIAPTSMTSAISKRLLPSALICSGSKGFCDGMFMGFYWISWDSRWNLRDFMGRRLWISWHVMGFSWILHSSLWKKHVVVSCHAETLGPKSNKETLRIFAPGVKLPGVPPLSVDGLPMGSQWGSQW